MSEDSGDLWARIEDYVGSLILPDDSVLEEVLASSAEAGLPSIQVSAPEGAFLHMIARLLDARAILEVGTLAGYGAIWMGRALAPGGRLVTLEIEPKYAELARANLERAGLGEAVEVRVGPAAESLAHMVDAREGPFDLVFIDADKKSTPEYFERALALTRPGSVIVVDNVVRKGALVDEAEDKNPDIVGMRRFLEAASAEPRVTATVLQTVGSKGHDGFAFVMVRP